MEKHFHDMIIQRGLSCLFLLCSKLFCVSLASLLCKDAESLLQCFIIQVARGLKLKLG